MGDSPTPESGARSQRDGTVIRLASKARGYLAQYKTEKSRTDGLKTDVDKLQGEVQQLRESTSAKKVEELTGELRGLKHRAVFDRLAKEQGVREGAANDLYQLSGWKADGDVVDETAMKQAIEAQKTARAYLFGEAQPNPAGDGGTPPTTPPPTPKPGPAHGQGGGVTNPPKFTDDQLSDPKFAYLNFDKISAAASERVARGEI